MKIDFSTNLIVIRDMKEISFRFFRNRDYYMLAQKFLSVLGEYNISEIKMDFHLPKLQLSFDNFDKTYQKVRKSELTDIIESIDIRRDNAFDAFKYYVHACSLRNEPEISDAAKVVKITIKSIGWTLQKDGLNEETSKLKTLFNEIENSVDLTNYIEIIGAKQWYNSLKSEQEEYDKVFLKRENQKSDKPNITANEARNNLKKDIQELWIYINVINNMNNNKKIDELIGKLSNIVKDTKSIVSSRKQSTSKQETNEN